MAYMPHGYNCTLGHLINNGVDRYNLLYKEECKIELTN